MLSITGMNEMVADRGPRYAVTGTIRRDEYAATYALDSAAAESMFEHYQTRGYRNVKVHVPTDGGVTIDLATYGRDRDDALRAAKEKTEILRAAILRAIEGGRAEAEVARSAGIDRMTVRDWNGK